LLLFLLFFLRRFGRGILIISIILFGHLLVGGFEELEGLVLELTDEFTDFISLQVILISQLLAKVLDFFLDDLSFIGIDLIGIFGDLGVGVMDNGFSLVDGFNEFLTFSIFGSVF